MGIYDIFKMAAKGAEKIPWQYRLLAGSIGGAAVEGVFGDKNTPLNERVAKGAMVGTALGLGAGFGLRGAGKLAVGAETAGRAAITSKMAAIKSEGMLKALTKPGTLILGGAVAGAAIAPSGHRMQGAVVGAGVGYLAKPAMSLYKGYEGLGKIPGAQTGLLVAGAATAVAASVAFSQPTTEGGGSTAFGTGGAYGLHAVIWKYAR
jgi:hypothetical protein